MNSALPPPVLIGTKRPSAFETCSVHGTIGSAKASVEDRGRHEPAAGTAR